MGKVSGRATGSANDCSHRRRPVTADPQLPIEIKIGEPRSRRSGTTLQSFGSAQDGLGAMAAQLQRYANRDGLDTIDGIIHKYAPARGPGNSAATEAGYKADVAQQTGFAGGQRLDLNNPAQLAPLLSAMVKHEQGRDPFSPGP